MTLTTVPILQNDRTGELVKWGSPEGQRGSYEIVFILSSPGTATHVAELNLPELLAAGSSFLELPADLSIPVSIENSESLLTLSRNGEGRLAKATLTIHAESFDDAVDKAHNVVAPVLSDISFAKAIPIDILGWSVRARNSGAARCSFRCLGVPRKLAESNLDGISTPKCCRSLLSAYREGMNSTNPFYQFLSFFRVLEGIEYLRRDQVRTSLAGTFQPNVEKFPKTLKELDLSEQDEFFIACFKPYLGKKFTSVRDKLRQLNRNAIAHLNPVEDPVAADIYNDVSRFEQAVPVVHYMVRIVLDNEVRAQKLLDH